MTFRFRKLYADVVMPDGTVAIVYLAWLDCAGFHSASAVVEWYPQGGGRTAHYALSPPMPVDPDAASEHLSIELATAAGVFRLAYSEGWLRWTPAGAPRGLDWRVLQPRSDAIATWTDHSGTREWRGVGYVDWVECTRPPRRLGLRTLAWGRAHWPGGAAVFTAVELLQGPGWARAAQWRDGSLVSTSDKIYLERAEHGGLVVRVDERDCYRIAQGRTLHHGEGLDRERFPRFIDRIAARALTGPVHETRWICPVVVPGGDSDKSAALHELVRFGSPAQSGTIFRRSRLEGAGSRLGRGWS
jgi:hypothetical protein